MRNHNAMAIVAGLAGLIGLVAFASSALAQDASSRNENVLRPTILGEVDYRAYPSLVEGNSGFAVARVRPGLNLVPAQWFRAVTAIEFAGESAGIVDAYLRFEVARWFDVSVGYAKPPLFASFIYEPVHTLAFPDWSPVVNAFGVRRDLGVSAHVAPRTIPLEGFVRVSNGTGSPLGNDNALPAGYGLLDLALGRAHVKGVGERFGLRLGVGGFVEDTSDRDSIIGRTPLGFVYYRPIVVSGIRTIGEAHLVAYAGPLRLTVEAATVRENRSRDDDGNPETPRVPLDPVESRGASAELAWTVFGTPRNVGAAPGSWGFPKPGEPTTQWDGGALEIAARYDQLWLGRTADDVTAGGSKSAALAVKWWPANFMAATLFGYAMRYDVAPIEEPEELWSWGLIARLSFFWGLPGNP